MSPFVFALDEPPGETLDETTALVGGKAANLGVMLGPVLRLRVPPGFVITTATCRAYLTHGWPDGLDDEIGEAMARVEAAVGRRFGHPTDPLLVSVRSGAPVSMPGMMDTILNLGLTEATTAGLAAATGDAAFAADCRDRFGSMFRAVAGVDAVPEDPWRQLRLAIEAVFRSWTSDRARTYRQKEGIPDDLGTAVTIQTMVFGNGGANSATGVVFTRNPATGEHELYGDVLFDAQGEDVVSGAHGTEPVAVLDDRMPDIATELRDAADRLERHYADLCDIEFTIERGRLWMLQVRVGKRSPQAALRIAVEMAEDPTFPLTRVEAVRRVASLLASPPTTTTGRSGYLLPIVTGLGASPGVATGAIVTSPGAAQQAVEAGRAVILVRSETSPEDVHGMAHAAGILTARGGLASHAAVVARGWGIPAVVGAAALDVRDGSIAVDGRTLREGEILTIDGGSGEVFEGRIAATTEVVPEARTLLAWADELGIEIVHDVASVLEPAAKPNRNATIDDLVHAIGIKGFAPTQAVADAVGSTAEQVQPLLDDLVIDGLIASAAGAYRLTDGGMTRAADLRAADRAAWGGSQADAALDGFLGLDARMKDTVTAWQLREPDVINDHGDSEYDRAVLDRLAALHDDAVAFLAGSAGGPARLTTYRERLTGALERARAGDGRYVASPRVDSYHGIWFELHEDLIGLAGRTRAEEVEAGRA